MTDSDSVGASGRRIPLGAAEILVAIEDQGSLSGAARALHVAQPSVSVGLRRLEKLIGVTLVHRSASGAHLTTAGEALVGPARTMLAASDDLESEANRVRTFIQDIVTIATSPQIAGRVPCVWMTGGPNDHDAVEVTARDAREVMAAVVRGRADLGIIEGSEIMDGLAHRATSTARLRLVWAANRPLRPVAAERIEHILRGPAH